MTATIPGALATAELERWRRDGVIHPLTVLSPAEASALRDEVESVAARCGGRWPPVLNVKAHLLLPSLWSLVQDRRLLDPVEALIGPDILCWAANLFVKRPGDGKRVPWHQDETYWSLSAPRAVTLWLALTGAGPWNGGLRVIPGSHLAPVGHRDAGDPDSMLPLGEEVAGTVDESAARDVTLEAGQGSIHHARTIHGSAPNTAAQSRIGLAIRYVAGDLTQRGGRRGSATLVRGRDHGTFDLEAAPVGPFDPGDFARHRRYLRTFTEIVTSARAAAAGAPSAAAPPRR